MPAFIDLTGERYGRLTVVERAEECQTTGRQRVKWVCTCECGGITVALAEHLRSGNTRSCGCLNLERTAAMGRSTRIEKPGYSAAHTRVYAARGPATDHPCVDCGNPADEWAYGHTDPDELTRTRTDGRMKGRAVAYSADPAHYRALCVPCHRRFDRGRAA